MRKQGRRRAVVLSSSCSSIAGMNGAARDVAKRDKTVGCLFRCYGFVSRFPCVAVLLLAPSSSSSSSARFRALSLSPRSPSPPSLPPTLRLALRPSLPVSEVSPRLPRLALSAFPRVLVETSSRSCCDAVPAFQCHEVPVGGLASSVVPVGCFSCHATIYSCKVTWCPAPSPCPPRPPAFDPAEVRFWELLRPVPGLARPPAFSAYSSRSAIYPERWQ